MGTVDVNSLRVPGTYPGATQGSTSTQGPAPTDGTSGTHAAATPGSSVVMAPIALTLPEEKGFEVSALDQAQAPWRDAESPGSDNSLKRIEEGLQKANQAGVNAAKRTFWGKLAGTVMTGIGLTLFAIAAATTLGAAPLVVAGLVLTGVYLVKSTADTVATFRNLRNEQAVARGEEKPYHQPCGPDALANLLHPLILKKTAKGIDPANTAAMEKAINRAKLWSLGLSAFTELALIFAAAGTAGAAMGQLGTSLSLVGVRVVGGVAAMAMGMQKPASYQEASIALAQDSLKEARQEIDAIQIPIPSTLDDESLKLYQQLCNQKLDLQGRFSQAWDNFQSKLDSYREALSAASPEFSHGAQAAFDVGLVYGTDLVDKGMAAAQSPVFLPLAALGSLARAGVVAGRNLASLRKQESLENQLTQDFLDLDALLQKMRLEGERMVEKARLNYSTN